MVTGLRPTFFLFPRTPMKSSMIEIEEVRRRGVTRKSNGRRRRGTIAEIRACLPNRILARGGSGWNSVMCARLGAARSANASGNDQPPGVLCDVHGFSRFSDKLEQPHGVRHSINAPISQGKRTKALSCRKSKKGPKATDEKAR